MRICKHIIISILAISFASCAARYNSLTIVDDDLSLDGCQNQLVLSSYRGELGQYMYAKGSSAAYDYYRTSGSGSKQWLLAKWGIPDRSYAEKGVDYLVYEKRSKEAPHYDRQFIGGERKVVIGCKGDHIVYISAFFANCEKYMKGPVYVLPK